MLRLTALVLAVLPATVPAAPRVTPKRPKLAVTEIAAPNGDAALTALLSELALTEASASGRFAVIGQSDVAALLGQAQLRQMMGCSESECFSEIGGALGTDYLLVGATGALGPSWRVDVKLVDVKKQAVLARAGETLEPRPELLAAAIQRAVRQALAAAAPPLLTGRQRAGWITAGVGGACLAGSAVFGLLARSASKDLEAAEADGDAEAWDRSRDRLERRALVADVLLGAGLAGAGAGAWLVFGGGDRPAARVAALPGGAVATIQGRF